jgi:regulator of sirC expression with transglutaminase-like and TPR domain
MIYRELEAMIKLLEDPDLEVSGMVAHKLRGMGSDVIPGLEKAWEKSVNPDFQNRIEDIIHHIQFTLLKKELEEWISLGAEKLEYGAYLVARYQYPDLYFSEVEARIEKLRKDVWLEIHEGLTALEKVRVMNHIFFAVHKLSGNTANFYSPRNSYINQVLETKKGNPISLAILYSVVARKLDMPVYGVNLPLNYVLAYKNEDYTDDPNGILFYINPYNRGTVLSRKEIDFFLYEQKLESRPEYFLPCSNTVTIERLLNNLVFSYEKMGYPEKTEQINELLAIVKRK